MGPGLTQNVFGGNRPKIDMVLWGTIPCVFSVYVLPVSIRNQSHYNLNVRPAHVRDGFPKKLG